MSYRFQNSQHQGQQQQQEEAPPPPYTYTPPGTGTGAATQSRQLQFPPPTPGGLGSANPAPHCGGVATPPPLPARTPRTPRAPQFRGTVGAPQVYGEGVVDMSGKEYDAAPDSYFVRPTGPRAPQLNTQEESESGQGNQQEQQPVAAGGGVAAGILAKDDIQSYYQPPVFPDKKGENPLQDVKQPFQNQQQQQQPDPYYQSQQHSTPVVYRPPAAPQFSPQVDQHQQPHSISSVVNPVSSPAMGYAETPTMYPPPTTSYPPPTTSYPPPATAPSPASSHYPPPSTPPMFSPAAVVRPLPAVPLHHSGSVAMPVPMPMPEPSKLPMQPSAPEHPSVAPTPFLPPAGIPAPTPALAPASIPPPMATIPGGPGLVTHFKCKECGGLLDSEFAVCTRLHTPLTAYAAPQIGYSTRPDFHLDGQHPVPPVPQHQHHQHGYYPQPQQPQQHHGYYPQPQQHNTHPHNPYPPQQPLYGGYAHHYPQPTITTAVAAHPSNNHGTDDAYYRRPLTNGLKKLFGVATQSYGSNHQIVSPMPVAPPVQPVHHHMPGPQGQAGAYIPLAGPPPPQPQHHQQPYYQQQQQYPPAPYPPDQHHGMMSPVVGFQQPHYAMPGGGKDGYGSAGAGLMRSATSTQSPST
ncbi:MAG: hypothetical protein JOS17DRAFT_781418 [Linnemannia elongata]|nr:MAG: hypothetical protein JOS17DRAFT_781418 [Linnemannia elongata]